MGAKTGRRNHPRPRFHAFRFEIPRGQIPVDEPPYVPGGGVPGRSPG
jgi:hypothetical protein